MKKKTKRYDGEEGSLVETETAQGQNKSIGDDIRARAMAAMVNEPTPPTPPKKEVGKAITKAVKEEKAEPKKASPVQEAKDVVSGKGASTPPMPKSFTEAGGSSKASPAKADLSSFKVRAPDVLSGFDSKGKRISNMKSGGKVKSASARADGCAIRGKTRA
jgi:hypothetical protein